MDNDELENEMKTYTSSSIRLEWEKTQDTPRAIIQTECALLRIADSVSNVHIPLPSEFVFRNGKMISDEELRAPLIEKDSLLHLLQELKETQLDRECEISDLRSNSQPVNPIFWKGCRSDLVKTFDVLRSFLDCTQFMWELFFQCADDNLLQGGVVPEGRIANDNTSITVHSISPITWKAGRTDFGRVYIILENILVCKQTEWENHFVSIEGKPLLGAVSDARKDRKSGKEAPFLSLLRNAAKHFTIPQ